MKPKFGVINIFVMVAFTFGLVLEPDVNLWAAGTPVSQAEARVGRPITPISVAGVARRTTRRMVYRTNVYVSVLPRGCTVVTINGSGYHHCGATYYQPYGNQYVIVNIN